ncbi:HIT family protein [Nocardia sp. alder85J]|uniref:HIT family protein n=1 Tax=Nocardia sp. alder85J TaxID=2862949 RepID=UPI001CD528F5|nr:HIT domain-containing protein [Nocardia sp. alder85J]MCX4092998.1 hypothetical protein [Nocardia sp. alder85J]
MPDHRESCPFCERIANYDYDQHYNFIVVRIQPLNPVTPGHQLFVPTWHAEHPSDEAVRAAMGYAEYYGGDQGGDFNLITSSGTAATQTIRHIHVHYVPRRADDGLRLPWTPPAW